MSRKEGRVKAEPSPWWLKCCRGRWMEAQWSPQWSLNGRHWSSKGGTMVVQGRQTSRSNWYTMFAFLTGRPMADHCASILRPRRCVCLHPASFERPVSDRPPRRPLCDCFEHAQNFTTTMASMAMPERPVYHPWTTKATVLPPFCLQRRPGQFCGRTREAQRSQPLCKGGISAYQVDWVHSGSADSYYYRIYGNLFFINQAALCPRLARANILPGGMCLPSGLSALR